MCRHRIGMVDFPEPDEPCVELIIVPPAGAMFDDQDLHRQIKEFLERNFPEFNCIIATEGPRRDDSFVVLPLLGTAGGSEGKPLTAMPPRATIWEIGQILRDTFVDRPGSMVQ
jgi:hypothetical protein